MKTKSMAILTGMCAVALSGCSDEGRQSNVSMPDNSHLTADEKAKTGELIHIGEEILTSVHEGQVRCSSTYYYMIDTDGDFYTVEYVGKLSEKALKDNPNKILNDSIFLPTKTLDQWAKESRLYRVVNERN